MKSTNNTSAICWNRTNDANDVGFLKDSLWHSLDIVNKLHTDYLPSFHFRPFNTQYFFYWAKGSYEKVSFPHQKQPVGAGTIFILSVHLFINIIQTSNPPRNLMIGVKCWCLKPEHFSNQILYTETKSFNKTHPIEISVVDFIIKLFCGCTHIHHHKQFHATCWRTKNLW